MSTLYDHYTPGTVIDDKYRVDGIIGMGGMGVVYRGVQLSVDRPVAIKQLHPNHAVHPQLVQRFQREARLAASMGHDNICEVTEQGITEDGSPYLVMPLLDGNALSELLKREGGVLPLERIADIAGQTLSALSAAHDAGIVHRDIKPGNIFVTRMGDRRDFVKLLDFGISKVLHDDRGGVETQTGMAMGTPHYMAPEQALGDKGIDFRIDIYAVGVILYEALTGRRPYEGASHNQVIARILTEPFSLPRRIRPALSASMESVIIKAMRRDPRDRFESAEAMRKALVSAVRATSVVSEVRAIGADDTIPEPADAAFDTGVVDPPARPVNALSASMSVSRARPERGSRHALWRWMIVPASIFVLAAAGYLGRPFFKGGRQEIVVPISAIERLSSGPDAARSADEASVQYVTPPPISLPEDVDAVSTESESREVKPARRKSGRSKTAEEKTAARKTAKTSKSSEEDTGKETRADQERSSVLLRIDEYE